MGDVAAALVKIKQAKAAIGSNGADTSDPGVNLSPMDLPNTPMQDMGAGLSQGQAAVPNQSMPSGISLADLAGPTQSQPPAAAPTSVDNPYTPDDNTQNPAANIGTQDDSPITVTGDSWTPQHHEGWLGKGLDVLEMLHGRGTPFKDRKDNENIDDALKTYQSNPEQAIHRVAQISGPTAVKMYEQLQAQRINQANADRVIAATKDEGSDRLGNMLGFLQTQKAPDAAYTKMLPTLRSFATQHGYSSDEAQNMLPDQYDPDKVAALRSQSISTYDQGRLSQEDANSQRIAGYQDEELNLRKQGLGIEQANSRTEQARAIDEMQRTQTGTFAQRQHFYTHVLGGAARLPWIYGGFMTGTFGKGSSGLPKPGVAYMSPDKTLVARMGADGSWNLYQVKGINSKGIAGLHLLNTLPGVNTSSASDDTNGYFANP